jgi:alkylation response protein AidB-like acyl-CoA dehydrogenase
VLFSERQIAVQNGVSRFELDEIRPRSRAFAEAGGYPAELFVQLAELGLTGMTAPEAVGGAATDYVSCALALVELGAADGGLSKIVSIQNSLMVSGLMKIGSPSQQARFLPNLTSGRMIGAFALTRTDAGSDAVAIATSVLLVDGGWRLNGTKQFIISRKSRRCHGVHGNQSGRRQERHFRLPRADQPARLYC